MFFRRCFKQTQGFGSSVLDDVLPEAMLLFWLDLESEREEPWSRRSGTLLYWFSSMLVECESYVMFVHALFTPNLLCPQAWDWIAYCVTSLSCVTSLCCVVLRHYVVLCYVIMLCYVITLCYVIMLWVLFCTPLHLLFRINFCENIKIKLN